MRGGTATRRFAGTSAAPFGPANYSDRGGDDPAAVARNRALLRQQLGLPGEPLWLQQVHGTEVLVEPNLLGSASSGASSALREVPCADASVVRGRGSVAVVLTADCLPLLLAAGDSVAAVHAGWRGLADGVIEAAIRALGALPGEVCAWLGPGIGQRAFEVGPEVRAIFVAADPAAAACFIPGRADRWHADLDALARRRLGAIGVERIGGGGWCTFDDPAQFHSYRRDGARSGRMATLVWRV
ncbi:MAG: peptidoglycan editing factor PgeF [Rhodanobacteraceae bacterium]|nr:peptidoglycan editing factor PgeF [Rhodanobacteraceae bacterium]